MDRSRKLQANSTEATISARPDATVRPLRLADGRDNVAPLNQRVRALVAEHDPLAGRAIRTALEGAGVSVVAAATTAPAALELALYHRPDVMLVELALPGLDATDLIARIVEGAPEVRVIVLSTSADEQAALRVLQAGASGFVGKDAVVDALPRIVTGVARGEAAISRDLSMALVERLRAVPPSGQGFRPVRSVLTNREWEIVDLVCGGASTRQIAEELVLTLDTVYTHLKNVMRKLGVHSRGEIAAAAGALRFGSPDSP